MTATTLPNNMYTLHWRSSTMVYRPNNRTMPKKTGNKMNIPKNVTSAAIKKCTTGKLRGLSFMARLHNHGFGFAV